jgi:transposase-like protein
MAQHFLLSAAARSLSPGKLMRMSERGAENVFVRLRWPETDGRPVCPQCGCQTCYDCRRSENQSRWRCKACRADFTATSGTLFAWHKLPLRTYLMAIAVFCNEVKGKSMLAFCRDLDVQYKTAFVLAHKLREAMASAVKALRIGGEGRTAEIDGAYFGGMIVAQTLTDQDADDPSQVGPLLDQIDDPIVQVTADGAYDGAPTYQTIAAHADAIEVVIPPRSTAVLSGEPDLPTQRDRHLAMIAEQGRLTWQAATGYGQRSLVETTMGRYKALLGPRLRARGFAAQQTEAAIGVAVLNRMLAAGRPDSVRRQLVIA